MFREKYILDNELIKPDEQLLTSLKNRMKTYSSTQKESTDTVTELISHKEHNRRRTLTQYGSLVACFLILIISIATYRSLKGSNQKPSSKTSKEMAVAESTADSSYNMASEEYSADTTEESTTGDDASSKKSTLMDEEKANLTMGLQASSAFVDGKFKILSDTVNTILISGIPESADTMKEFTDKTDILDMIDVLNTLTLKAATENPKIDVTQDRFITLQYNNGSGDDIIQLNSNFLKVNDSDWYTITDKGLKQLNQFLQK